MISRAWTTVMLALSVAAGGGCQTSRQTSDGRPMPPDPRPAPPVPSGERPNEMALLVMVKAADTDGNSFPDTISASAALFASPHPSSLHADGRFEFTLYRLGDAHDPSAMPLARWTFTTEEAMAARSRDLFGPCYEFRLSLKGQSDDRLPSLRGDLRAVFVPADGSPPIACSDEPRPVMLGRSE